MSLTILIITKNEADHIRACLESAGFADEIIVVDSGSTDGTVAIARECGAHVIESEWLGYGGTKQFGADRATGRWIFWLDADERIPADLQVEILDAVRADDYDGYYIPRKAIFLGRWIKHCGWYPGYVVRLFKQDKGRFSDDLVHESVCLDGASSRLNAPLIHYTDLSLEHYLQKFNTYTSLAARQLYEKDHRFRMTDLIGRPFFSFIKMYIIKRGFLDGLQGFILCVLSACYVFTKYAKLWHYYHGNETRGDSLDPKTYSE